MCFNNPRDKEVKRRSWVSKILNGYKNIDRNMFFSLKKDSRTRAHEVTLVKDKCILDVRKYSFSERTINEWNKLSTDCVTASSVNMFKNKVGTYPRRESYTYVKKCWSLYKPMASLLNIKIVLNILNIANCHIPCYRC